MTYQIIAVDDAAPGPCVDVGITWNGSDTITSTEAIEATSLTLSGALTGGASSNIAINTNKFTVDAASGNTIIAGTLEATGASTIGEVTASGAATFNNSCGFGANINTATSGSVTIPLDTIYDSYSTNAIDVLNASLADGVAGQFKIIKLNTFDTNNMVLTPANFADGTTITFSANNEVAILIFDGTNWQLVYTNASVA